MRSRYEKGRATLEQGPWTDELGPFRNVCFAKHVVHYTPNELTWECKTTHCCECSVDLEHHGGLTWCGPVLTKALNGPALDVARWGALWEEVVSEYSRRKLTVPGDVLPALSGLARQFAIAQPGLGKYLGGIWFSQLPDALGWSRFLDGTRETRPRHAIATYEALSWSWASAEADNGVQFFNDRVDGRLLKLMAADGTPSGHDPFGQVSDGYCIVEGDFGPKVYRSTGLEEDDVWALKIRFSDWNLWHSLLLVSSIRVPGAWEMLGLDVAGGYCFEGRGKSVVKIV